MSETAATIILGALIVFMIKTRWVRFSGALLCVVFGMVFAAGPMGPAAADVLNGFGSWAYAELQTL